MSLQSFCYINLTSAVSDNVPCVGNMPVKSIFSPPVLEVLPFADAAIENWRRWTEHVGLVLSAGLLVSKALLLFGAGAELGKALCSGKRPHRATLSTKGALLAVCPAMMLAFARTAKRSRG